MANLKCRGEPSLSEILEDPIVQDLMVRDGIERASLELLVGRMREKRTDAEAILASNFW